MNRSCSRGNLNSMDLELVHLRNVGAHTTVDTLDDGTSAHLCFGNSTDTGRSLIVHVLVEWTNQSCAWRANVLSAQTYSCLNTPQATQLFISRFLPFSNKALSNNVSIKVQPKGYDSPTWHPRNPPSATSHTIPPRWPRACNTARKRIVSGRAISA